MANSPAVIASNTRIVLNSTVVSMDFTQVKLAITQALHDVTTFGSSLWKEWIAGLNEATIDLTGFFDNAANKFDAALWNMLGGPGAATGWEIDIPNSSVGSTRYSGTCWAKTYSPDGDVNGPWKANASLQVQGAPVRATIAS